jgi:hypothetical protein
MTEASRGVTASGTSQPDDRTIFFKSAWMMLKRYELRSCLRLPDMGCGPQKLLPAPSPVCPRASRYQPQDALGENEAAGHQRLRKPC